MCHQNTPSVSSCSSPTPDLTIHFVPPVNKFAHPCTCAIWLFYFCHCLFCFALGYCGLCLCCYDQKMLIKKKKTVFTKVAKRGNRCTGPRTLAAL